MRVERPGTEKRRTQRYIRHHELMVKYVNDGISRAEASVKALKELEKE